MWTKSGGINSTTTLLLRRVIMAPIGNHNQGGFRWQITKMTETEPVKIPAPLGGTHQGSAEKRIKPGRILSAYWPVLPCHDLPAEKYVNTFPQNISAGPCTHGEDTAIQPTHNTPKNNNYPK